MVTAYKYFALLGLIWGVACAPRPTSTTGGDTRDKAAAKSYIEDISAYRPNYSLPDASAPGIPAVVTPTNHVNEQVNILMDTVAANNKTIKYAQGFRIMAYNGTNRQAAMDVRRAIIERVPEQKDYLLYQQPSYRLKIGDYFNRVEAQQTLLLLQDIIPNALIIPDQINIR